MKIKLIPHHFFLVLLSVFLCTSSYAQNKKKNTVRLNVQYVKVMNGEIFLNIKATARVEKENIEVADIDLIVYNEYDGEEIEIGKIKTNAKGEGKLVLDNLNALKADDLNFYNINVAFEGSDSFKRASKSISIKNADVIANIITQDSIHYISAELWDTSDSIKIALPEQNLKVQLQRLFKPLRIGEEFNTTDENGAIMVEVENGLPGVDGILTFEVVLDESDEYGTVKALVQAPIGKPIVDESTFDERTMWSPRNKTPLFLLIFPNLLTLGIWSIIIYLVINLFKISKS